MVNRNILKENGKIIPVLYPIKTRKLEQLYEAYARANNDGGRSKELSTNLIEIIVDTPTI